MVGLYKIPLLDRVDRNQVDMTAQRRCQTDQLFRVLFCIVDAADQTIFKSQPPSGFVRIIAAGVHQLLHSVFVSDGHQPAALFICRRMQGKRQRDLKLFLRQLIHFRHNSAGRNRHIALADI